MFRKTLGLIAVAFLLAATLLLIGCDDDDDPTGPTTPANLLLEFDFENFARGQQVGSHTYAVSGITALWDTGNNGVEYFGENAVSATRWFGEHTPVLTFTTTETMTIARIEFTHYHNHNFVSTVDGYDVRVQIDIGNGFVDMGTCVADLDSYGGRDEAACPGELVAGTYSIRWVPELPLPGDSSSTGTDYFALDDVKIWSK